MWPDSGGRWHRYPDETKATSPAPLLDIVDADPTGIFWGDRPARSPPASAPSPRIPTRRRPGLAPEVRGRDGAMRAPRRAAVAVVVLDDPQRGPGVLLTRRTSKLRDHPGQFALPGGSVDPGEDDVTAARRELAEELGLQLGPEAVLGLLDDYPTRSGFVITPVVMATAARARRPRPLARRGGASSTT